MHAVWRQTIHHGLKKKCASRHYLHNFQPRFLFLIRVCIFAAFYFFIGGVTLLHMVEGVPSAVSCEPVSLWAMLDCFASCLSPLSSGVFYGWQPYRTWTLIWMGFNCGGQTGRQRAVRGKEEGWLCLVMIDGVTLGISLLRNRSAVRTSNFKLLAWGRTTSWGSLHRWLCSLCTSPPLLMLMQLVMFFIKSQTHCRHSTHSPSSLSLGTSIMPLCPPLYPHSHSMSPATPETIKHWTYCMPTARRHTTHPPSLPWEDLTTTWCISCLCTSPL